jgi:hypothetical protein
MTLPFDGFRDPKAFYPSPVARPRQPLLDALEEILKTEPRTDLRRYARQRYLDLTNDNERQEP